MHCFCCSYAKKNTNNISNVTGMTINRKLKKQTEEKMYVKKICHTNTVCNYTANFPNCFKLDVVWN